MILGVGIPDQDPTHVNKTNQIHVEDPQISFGNTLLEEITPRNLFLADREIGVATPGELYFADFEAPYNIYCGDGVIYGSTHNLQTPDNDFVVNSNAVVSMRAGESVKLMPGFSAKAGCVFRAYVNNGGFYENCQGQRQQANTSGEQNPQVRNPNKTKHSINKNEPEKISTGISVYPNPANNYLHVSLDKNIEIKEYTVFDINGKNLLQGQLNTNYINISDLNTGIFMLRIQDKQGIIHNIKFIKQ